jgi:hypothetical protein
VDDSIDLGPWFDRQAFTIGMWVKPGASQVQYADILDNNHTGSRSWVIQQDGSTTNRYVWGPVAPGSQPIYFSLAADTWQHLAITRDASGVSSVYVNGELLGSTPQSGAIAYDGSLFLRVGRWGGGGRNWRGLIGEVDVYDHPLTRDEIQMLYQADGAGKCAKAPPSPPAAPANAVCVNAFETGETSGRTSSSIDVAPSGRE